MLPHYNKFVFAICQFSENGSCWFNNTAACPYQAMLVVTAKINVLCNIIMIMAYIMHVSLATILIIKNSALLWAICNANINIYPQLKISVQSFN